MSFNYNAAIFCEKVDAVMVGTGLGEEREIEYRMKRFKEGLECFREKRREYNRKMRELRAINYERSQRRLPLFRYEEFKLSPRDEGAMDLIVAMAVVEQSKDVYKKVTAADIFNKLMDKTDKEIENDLLEGASKLQDEKKIIEPICKVLAAEGIENFRVTALVFLQDEVKKEKERERLEQMYPYKGDYYYLPNIPLWSAYEWGKGWTNHEDRVAFTEECKKLFSFNDWKFVVGGNGCSDELVRGRSYVYLHPMGASVYGRKEEIAEIVNRFEMVDAKTFKVGRTNLESIRAVKDMTYREAFDAYKAMDKDIRSKVVNALKGKKTVYDYNFMYELYGDMRIQNTAEENFIGKSSGEIGYRVISDVIKNMQEEKVIAIDKTGKMRLTKKSIEADLPQEEKVKTRTFA